MCDVADFVVNLERSSDPPFRGRYTYNLSELEPITDKLAQWKPDLDRNPYFEGPGQLDVGSEIDLNVQVINDGPAYGFGCRVLGRIGDKFWLHFDVDPPELGEPYVPSGMPKN